MWRNTHQPSAFFAQHAVYTRLMALGNSRHKATWVTFLLCVLEHDADIQTRFLLRDGHEQDPYEGVEVRMPSFKFTSINSRGSAASNHVALNKQLDRSTSSPECGMSTDTSNRVLKSTHF